MNIEVPADKLPNSNRYKKLEIDSQKLLTEFCRSQVVKAGLANAGFSKSLYFSDPKNSAASLIHIFKLIETQLISSMPYLKYLRNSLTTGLTGLTDHAEGHGLTIRLLLKDRAPELKKIPPSQNLLTKLSISQSQHCGAPAWLTRYLAMINRKAREAGLPIAAYLNVESYELESFETLFETQDVAERSGVVQLNLSFAFVGWKEENEETRNRIYAQALRSCGKYGRTRHPSCISPRYYSSLENPFELGVLSKSPYTLVFHIESLIRIFKSLQRKMAYVPTVYSVSA